MPYLSNVENIKVKRHTMYNGQLVTNHIESSEDYDYMAMEVNCKKR